MTTPATPSASKSAATAPVEDSAALLTPEDRLRIFWKKNSKGVIILVTVVLLAVLGKGVWDYLETQKEIDLGRQFAAATTPEQLKTFAAANAGHELAGVARLRIADAAYADGKSTDAISGYEAALSALKPGPLASRAKLGLAMARIQAGKTADGESGLRQLAADTNESKGIRVEACYQLASLAAAAQKADDVRKYAQQVMQIDANSPWLQRVFILSASLPPAAPETAAVAPVALPTPAK